MEMIEILNVGGCVEIEPCDCLRTGGWVGPTLEDWCDECEGGSGWTILREDWQR